MQRMLTYVVVSALAAGVAVTRIAADSKASELVARARTAIGGDARLGTIAGLSCRGTLRRTIGDRQVSGEITIDLQLPDKLLRTEAVNPLGDLTLVTEQGLNGDALIRRSRTLNAPPGAVIRTPPAPAPGSDAETQALRNARAELARWTMALLLTTPASAAVDVTSAGEAEAPDAKADVVEMKGAGGFAAKLFLDQSSHRPLMLAYRGVSPRLVVTTAPRGAPPPAHANPPETAPEVVDVEMFLDDYRPVDGVLLPHRIVRAVGGETTEEWTFTTIRVNPAFAPDTFAK